MPTKCKSYVHKIMLFVKPSWYAHGCICALCSDFPFVVGECGYANARRVLDSAKGSVLMTDEDVEWIMGRTAMELFKSVWDKAS